MARNDRSGDALPARGDGSDSSLESLVADYLGRLNDGERLDRARILAEHPDVGEAILSELEAFVHLRAGDDSNEPLGIVGDYTLRRQIGRGGMGVVYEAWESSMERRVALKILPAGVATDDRAFQRFMRDAKTAGKLSHPSIVPVYFTGMKEQTPFYAMEYVEGDTLAHVLDEIKEAELEAETPFGRRDTLGYFSNLAMAFADVADGLQHAHSKGVIHRDIKPSNLILDGDGRLRILDFGLARLEGQDSLTLSGDFVGTPLYMSPEQARRRKIPIDHRTDIYSLGATMYESLCGQPPFRGQDHADTLSQIIEREPVEPRKLNPRVPKDLETIVLQCLRKDAGDRYRTAEALGQDLRRFERGDPVEARPQSAWDKAARRLWKHRAVFGGTLLVLVLATSALGVMNAFVTRARDEARCELYISNMRLAAEDWRAGSFERFVSILDRHVPKSGEPDLRGWEWYVLEPLSSPDCLTLGRHSSAVETIAWNHAGTSLATASQDGTVKLWNVADESEFGTFRHEACVESLLWSGNGERLASVGRDGAVKVWESGGVEDLFRLHGHIGTVSCAAWSAGGNLLASGDSRGEVRIWDHASGRLEAVLHFADPGIRDAAISSLAWSPDGSWLAAGTKERELGPIFIWDATTWSRPVRLEGHRRPAPSLAWSPDGRRLASGSYRQDVKLWDTTAWTELATLRKHLGIVWRVAWSSDGSWLASAAADGTLRVWDPETFEESHAIRGHFGEVRSVAWSPDGRFLASGDTDGITRVWKAFQEQGPVALRARYRACWSPDGTWVAACDQASENDLGEVVLGASLIAVFDAATGERVGRLAAASSKDEQCHSLDWSPGGRRLATVWKDGSLRVWSSETGIELFAVAAHQGRAGSVAWSPDGKCIATAGHGGVKVWDPVRGTNLRTLVSNTSGSVAWSRDGTRLAAPVKSAVKLWTIPAWEELPDLLLPDESGSATAGEYSIAWNPQGDRLACGTGRGALVVFDVTTGEVLHAARAHMWSLTCVAWSPDGARIATGSRDRTVRIWDPETGAEILMLARLAGNVLSLSWDPTGKRLVAGDPFSVRIWTAPGFERGR